MHWEVATAMSLWRYTETRMIHLGQLAAECIIFQKSSLVYVHFLTNIPLHFCRLLFKILRLSDFSMNFGVVFLDALAHSKC